jgi:hypothetical protein
MLFAGKTRIIAGYGCSLNFDGTTALLSVRFQSKKPKVPTRLLPDNALTLAEQ